MREGSMAASSTSPPSTGSPCAACKFLRRKCTMECAFAPYFPPDQPQRFVNVHKIFGASNVTKLINEVPVHQREDAVNSLVYEAEARMKDPVYGCVGAISLLQQKIAHLQAELAIARSELARYAAFTGTLMLPASFHGHGSVNAPASPLTVVLGSHEQAQQQQQQHHVHMQQQQQQHVAALMAAAAAHDHHVGVIEQQQNASEPYELQSAHGTTEVGSSSASSGPSNASRAAPSSSSNMIATSTTFKAERS